MSTPYSSRTLGPQTSTLIMSEFMTCLPIGHEAFLPFCFRGTVRFQSYFFMASSEPAVRAVSCYIICCTLLLLLTHVSAYDPTLRSILGTTSLKSFSITQVRDARWKPKTVSTTEVYAASFLKHNRPMPEPLRSAWNELQSQENFGLSSRVNGGTTTTSDGL